MSEEMMLLFALAMFASLLIGFLCGWLSQDSRLNRAKRDLFQARCIATAANTQLMNAYHDQIQTIDRITEQNHATMTAIRQIRQWIDTVHPTVPIKANADRYDVTKLQIVA